MPDAPPLELEDLGHAFGRHPVFTAVALVVHPGEFVAVLGPSGCGKSTLLRTIAGLVTPTAGTVRVGGEEAARDGQDLIPVEQRHVGLVFQDYALFPYLSVRDNIAFGLPSPNNGRVDELLEIIGLTHMAKRRPGRLSGGQQQRVALARALAPRPRLLLLDEPFANVDVALRQSLAEELARVVAAQRTSVLLVTHDRTDALGLADRVAVMVPGPEGARVAQCDTPEQVYQRPVARAVAQLVGAAGFVPGTASGNTADTALGRIPLVASAHGAVELVLRPDNARFEPAPGGEAEVVSRRFRGTGYRLTCHTPAGECLVDVDTAAAPEPGTRGRVVAQRPCWALPTAAAS